MNSFSPFVIKISQIHDNCILRWQLDEVKVTGDDFTGLVEKNHSFNYQLWHAEDEARRDDLGFEYVYRAKRAIDQFNQQRNNMMETIDAYIVNALAPNQSQECPVHSETPGMIIDRLSILSLKIYHMGIQATRESADEEHRQNCTNKHQVLLQQRAQLASCLNQLILDIAAQTKTFRVYHQFKMYNDPALRNCK